MPETIEQKVAKEVLQQPEDIKVGDKTYKFYPPSTATLILVSEAISKLPKMRLSSEHIAEDSLYIAKDCRGLGEIVAILLLGAKHLKETIKDTQIKEIRLLWGLLRFKRSVKKERVVDRKAELSRQILEDITPRELHTLTRNLLMRMQIGDFFGVTTFLLEINLLKQTREVVTTVSGPSLQEQ